MRWLGLAMLACACGPVVDIGGGATTSGDAGTSGRGTTVTTGGADEHATVSDEVTTVQPDMVTTEGETTSTTSESDPSVPFLIPPDDGGETIECDVWAQGCPSGEKCMPWANDGGGSWNATRCSPIADDPREVGEPCTVEGSGVSGIDDCVTGSMCWNVDSETNTGECVGFCQGSEANPLCVDPCMQCAIYNEGLLSLCLAACDPLAQDCDRGNACYASGDTFVCAPDPSPEQGQVGDPCKYLNDCDPGTFCAPPEQVPGCEGEAGCCAAFCDANAEGECSLPGTTCVPWYEPGREPDGCQTAAVGGCLLPP